MKFVKLKEVIKTLELLKNEYDNLKLLIADQVKDDEIEEAKRNFDKLLDLEKAIEQMENLEVQVG